MKTINSATIGLATTFLCITTGYAAQSCTNYVNGQFVTVPCNTPAPQTPVPNTVGHTVGVRGVADSQNNSKNYTLYVVGRQGGIGVTLSTDSSFSGQFFQNPYVMNQTPCPSTSTQPSPLAGVNKKPLDLVGTLTTFPYDLKIVCGKDVNWRYKSGEILAYLQIRADATQPWTKFPCALTSTFTVGQSVYIHYSWDTSKSPITGSCHIDPY